MVRLPRWDAPGESGRCALGLSAEGFPRSAVSDWVGEARGRGPQAEARGTPSERSIERPSGIGSGRGAPDCGTWNSGNASRGGRDPDGAGGGYRVVRAKSNWFGPPAATSLTRVVLVLYWAGTFSGSCLGGAPGCSSGLSTMPWRLEMLT